MLLHGFSLYTFHHHSFMFIVDPFIDLRGRMQIVKQQQFLRRATAFTFSAWKISRIRGLKGSWGGIGKEMRIKKSGELVQKERRTSSQQAENLFKICRDAHLLFASFCNWYRRLVSFLATTLRTHSLKKGKCCGPEFLRRSACRNGNNMLYYLCRVNLSWSVVFKGVNWVRKCALYECFGCLVRWVRDKNGV